MAVYTPAPHSGDLKWKFDRDPENFHRRTFEISLWDGDIPMACLHQQEEGIRVQARVQSPAGLQLWLKLPAVSATVADAKAVAEAFMRG